MDEFKKPVLVLGANPAWQKIVSCPRLVAGDVVRVKLDATGAAGKGFNTARVVRAFRIPVVLVSAAGTDAPAWEEACRDEGVTTRLFPIAGRIRTATTINDRARNEVTEIVEEGPEASEGAAATLDLLMRNELSEASLVVVAGTFPPGLSPRGVLEILADATVPVILDSIPGIRSLRDLDRSPAQLILKLNQKEWKSVFGEADLSAALKQARRLWPKAELLATRGDEGALLWSPDGSIHSFSSGAFAPGVAINPIGAGDAFSGGIAVHLARGGTIVDACLHGMAVARASCLNPLPARFSMEEVAISKGLVQIDEPS